MVGDGRKLEKVGVSRVGGSERFKLGFVRGRRATVGNIFHVLRRASATAGEHGLKKAAPTNIPTDVVPPHRHWTLPV